MKPHTQDESNPQFRADELFKILCKRTFRREQPDEDDAKLMINMIAECIEQQKPIRMIKYWGKTSQNGVGVAEREALKFLADNLETVAAKHAPGVELTVLFVDTHVKFNGAEVPQTHLDELQDVLQDTFACRRNLRVGLDLLSNHIPFHPTADNKGYTEFDQLAALAAHSDITPELRDKLAPRSEKYYTRTEDAFPTVAAMYYELCKMERPLVGAAFPDHIFLTYNPADQKFFSVPEGLPSINVSSLHRGFTEKPWNMSNEDYAAFERKFRYSPRSMPERFCQTSDHCDSCLVFSR